MRFLDRIVANSGASLTAGGTVLAVGAALGAVGLTETSEAVSPSSPFNNGWVLGGSAVGLLGAGWVIFTFALAMVSTAKTERFHELLGHALNDGEALVDERAPKATVAAWGQQTHDLIEAGLGPAEARLFLGEWGLGTLFASGKEPPGHLWLERRLIRLSRLMDRMHLIHVGPRAKLIPRWNYRSSKTVPTPEG